MPSKTVMNLKINKFKMLFIIIFLLSAPIQLINASHQATTRTRVTHNTRACARVHVCIYAFNWNAISKRLSFKIP